MGLHTQLKADLIKRQGVENAFELINIYKGLPLAYKATLETIGDHSLQMSVDSPSSVCLSWENSTIILDIQHSLAFEAQIVSFYIEKGIVELSDLSPTDRGFGFREMARVEPDKPIPVKISGEVHTVIGEMLDISLTGIGIQTHYLGDPPLKIGDIVRLAVILMGKNTGPSGTIISVLPEEGTYRLGIRFTLEETVPNLIARYVTRRRAEIHREIQDAYNAAYQDAAV
jgi:hypothetical protein